MFGRCSSSLKTTGGVIIHTSYHDHHSLSRRRFLQAALVGAGTLPFADRLAMADAMLRGEQQLTPADIKGKGVQPGIVNIGSNENPWGPPSLAIEALARHMNNVNRYDWSADNEVVKRLVRMHNLPRRHSMNENLMFESGSSQLLHYAGLLGIRDGQGESIEAVPGYRDITKVFTKYRDVGYDTNAIRVPTTEEYVHDLDAMLAAITPKTTVISITNPNNPSGTLIPYDDLERFVDAVPEDILIVIDEAYIHFVDDPNYRNAILLGATRKNVIVLRTFSKMYGMAAMRLGYAVADKNILDRIKLYRTSNIGTVSHLTYQVASAALDDHDFVAHVWKKTIEGRAYLYHELEKMGVKYIPSQSNFMIVDLERKRGPVKEYLEKKNVYIGTFGLDNYPTWIRPTIGTPQELEVFVSILKEAMGKTN